MKRVERLRGMHDLSQEAWLRKRDLQDHLQELIGGHGYRLLEMPLLEPTELFLRKSGGTLASQIYSFTDAGNNLVSLRPEFTSPIMRHYLEHADQVELPARWQYAGPVFRYELADSEGSGQFTQIGAELIGSGSVLADVELLTLAALVPAHLGITGCRVELADLDVIHGILDAVGVSERARGFIVGSIPQLRQGPEALSQVLERAKQLHLGGHDIGEEELSAAVMGLEDAQARQVLQGFLEWRGGAAQSLGQRSPEQVVDRLLRKLRGSDDQGKLELGLELIGDLVAIRGSAQEVIEGARKISARVGANPAALDRLAKTLALVREGPAQDTEYLLDFGLAREIAYYNGIVFEVKHPAWSGNLGGGGRYDGLARALGGEFNVPASGFAYTLEALLSLSEWPDALAMASENAPSYLVSAADQASQPAALQAVHRLRAEGHRAELDVSEGDLASGLEYAGKRGLSQVVVVRADGNQTVHEVK
jgi:histidyl-tRNA synthetase